MQTLPQEVEVEFRSLCSLLRQVLTPFLMKSPSHQAYSYNVTDCSKVDKVISPNAFTLDDKKVYWG